MTHPSGGHASVPPQVEERAGFHGVRRSCGSAGGAATELPSSRTVAMGGDGLQVLHDLRFLVLLKVTGGEQEGLGVVSVGVRIRRTARTLIGNVLVDWELRSPANDCGQTPVVCGRSTFWMESAVLDAHTMPLCAGTQASPGRRSAYLLPEAVADDVACPLAVEEFRGAFLIPSGSLLHEVRVPLARGRPPCTRSGLSWPTPTGMCCLMACEGYGCQVSGHLRQG